MTVGVIVVVAALVYGVVVALYAIGSRVTTPTEPDVAQGSVVVRLSADSVNASGNRITVSLLPTAGPGYVDDSGIISDKSFSLLVSGTDGSRAIDYPAEQLISSTEVHLVTDGHIEQWPFDTYTATSLIVAAADTNGNGVAEALPTAVVAEGRVPGWNIRATTFDAGDPVQVDGETVTPRGIVLTASRSASTVAFGIVLLSLMVVIPVLVLLVATAAFRGRRKVEATLTSWIGAMLFATLPLRNFLPGAPPIGSWIDYLIVLWVMVGLVAGLALFVTAWLRRAPLGDPPTSQRSAAPDRRP